MNRVGFLCSRCKDSYSAVLGTRRCKQCSNWYILLFPIFVAIGIIAIIIIRYFNITITAGFVNGAIFYSNIVSIYGQTLVPGDTLTNGAIVLVSFPTLNLGFETCLHDRMTTLEKVWWQLSFPFYLFILMGITTCLARTKCLKFNQSAGFGTIQAFATLLLLCYVSVLEACIELIGFTMISTIDGRYYLQWTSDPSLRYFGREHAILGLLAYLILVVYIIPLPLLLLFPSALYRNRYLSKFKPIYDAFWDPYKPRYRFFLGFRLIFRWIPFALAITTRAPINIFVTNFLLILLLVIQFTVQPFREKWSNFIDAVFLCNLVLLFLGAVFFWSEYKGADETDRVRITHYGYIYSNIFIFLGFLVMLGIFIRHVIVRFPKLQKLIGHLLSRISTKKAYNIQLARETTDAATPTTHTTEKAEEVSFSGALNNGTSINQLQTVTRPSALLSASELREPLLESGTADLHDVNPLSVPERIQTFYRQ